MVGHNESGMKTKARVGTLSMPWKRRKTMMKSARYRWLIFAISLFAAGCCGPRGQNTLTQISTIDALLAGVYDGNTTLQNLSRHGDFGIGTFDRLDGEMIVLDGTVYQVRADGVVYRPGPDETTPFASVVHFRPRHTIPAPPAATYAAFTEWLDREFVNPNDLMAIRVDGTFSYVKVRSVPAQNKPYPPLAEVTKTQPVFEAADVSGTLIGFRAPAFVKGLNVPGYHVHFLSDDRQFGGHVLDFHFQGGEVQLMPCSRFVLLLPDADSDFAAVDFRADRSHELEKVEK
jgi:acetolactate decarboxylase